MSLFKRSVVAEILSHAGVVFSTLIIVWLSVLLVRLLGEAAAGTIGADVVIAISAFSSITALPIILIVSLFIAILTTISRNYREQEMFVWFSSGVSLANWINPVFRIAIPVALLLTVLTMISSPWAYRQAEEYRQRYAQRSDIAKVAQGQFLETARGQRVFFIEPSENKENEMGSVFARELNANGTVSFISAQYANFKTDEKTQERFIELGPGSRYDLLPKSPEVRVAAFEEATLRLENDNAVSENTIRAIALQQLKARPTELLLKDKKPRSDAQLMWRVSLPIALLNLALLAIPLGSVNPRMGKSGSIIIAALVGLLYMNLLNMMRGWIGSGKFDFWTGTILVNAVFFLFAIAMFWWKTRVKAPKSTA
ncbi:LPS export ABC transporter permease LptF [Pelistega suis]|uniref:LPS export ABC transporter permease LptF n=1 Tax=Pelistega suis TaxID=1631957 RepID=UPI00211C8A8F|nr:LPS export ABC transporter permease LptF [Pelistega suis]MCQ9328468.1 LPS export ABC transporter permease LptF [Pelistega suis]